MKFQFLCALIAAIVVNDCCANADPDVPPPALSTVPMDGTYQIQICEGDCRSDPKTVSGLLVVDSSRSGFSNQSNAMQSFMHGTSGVTIPDYCYYFDPMTANSKGTLFEYDIVAFGKIAKGNTDAAVFAFSLGSPDFRYYSEVEVLDRSTFVGGWRSYFGINGGKDQAFPAKLHARRVAPANSAICFDAVRKFEQMSLLSFCVAFPQKTCEQGIRP